MRGIDGPFLFFGMVFFGSIFFGSIFFGLFVVGLFVLLLLLEILVELLNKLHQLLSFAFAYVEESHADFMVALNGLSHAGQPERKTLELELDFDSTINPHHKTLFGHNEASAHAQIQNAAGHSKCKIYKVEDGGSVDIKPGFTAAIPLRGGFLARLRVGFHRWSPRQPLSDRRSVPKGARVRAAQLRDLAGDRINKDR